MLVVYSAVISLLFAITNLIILDNDYPKRYGINISAVLGGIMIFNTSFKSYSSLPPEGTLLCVFIAIAITNIFVTAIDQYKCKKAKHVIVKQL